ncbi:hypothetical protein QO207_24300 [Pseudomonas sp. CAN2814]|uniref:hypothetical protein n=1 Tax=Pseudomonas sp. CAN1 TaxID=3046726 RepID=UPI002648E993|nr:hypothetical protein [Pseudomonas sp. CAN1]MDN6859720.1 hypothetical protein [Pseudomonas sp. CAN1]
MTGLRSLAAIACCALAMPVFAQKFSGQEVQPQYQPRYQTQPQWQQSPPAVQRIYISPGASGSVGTSSNWQTYDGYGGTQVPRGYGETRSGTVIIDQGSGGVRQSIEYPNGAVYPRGNGYYQQQ